jgi:hypothetical protein
MRVAATCVAAVTAALFLGAVPAVAGDSPAPPGSKVYIIWPSDGEVIHGGKLWLRMGARKVGVAPAGVEHEHTGHHHVIIDAPLPPFDEEIPADNNHLHFGAGQSEARVELPPGQHTLQLLMGDQNHVPHDPPLFSKKITVTVPE